MARSTPPAGPVWLPKTVKPLRTVALAAQVTAVLWTLLRVAQASAAPAAVRHYQHRLATGVPVGTEPTGFGTLSQLGAVAILLAYVATGVWLFRARANTMLINPQFRHKRGLSWPWVGWWFPLVQLWFPYQVVRDVCLASHARVPKVLLEFWWTSWLVALFAGAIAASSVGPTATSDSLQLVVPGSVAAAVAQVVGLVCWLVIIRSVTAAQSGTAPDASMS